MNGAAKSPTETTQIVIEAVQEACKVLADELDLGSGDTLVMLAMVALDGLVALAPDTIEQLAAARVKLSLSQLLDPAPEPAAVAGYSTAVDTFYAETGARQASRTGAMQ